MGLCNNIFIFFTILLLFQFSELEEENPTTESESDRDDPINGNTSGIVTVVDESTRSDDGDNSIQNCKVMIDRISLSNHDVQKSILKGQKEKDSSEIIVLSPRYGTSEETNNVSVLKEAENINGGDDKTVSNESQHDGDKTETSNINGNYSYGDDNDMYFMEDGGYNSFNLELPCTETSGDKGSAFNSRDKSIDVANETPKESKCEETTESKSDIVQSSPSKETDSSLANLLPQDSFNASDLERVDIDSAAIKTPQGKNARGRGEGEFKTPNNLPSLNQSEFTEEFETPQSSKIEDKDACKNFKPGCSKHPETKEAITPMPDFAQLPTPDLKVIFFVFGFFDLILGVKFYPKIFIRDLLCLCSQFEQI